MKYFRLKWQLLILTLDKVYLKTHTVKGTLISLRGYDVESIKTEGSKSHIKKYFVSIHTYITTHIHVRLHI